MIVYIGFAQRDEWCGWAGAYARHGQAFEDASGELCLIVPYDRVTPDLMDRLAPSAVVMSGFARSFEDYPVLSLLGVVDWLLEADTPILAICGSHQLVAFAFNQDLHSVRQLHDEPIRPLRPGEPVTNPDYHPDHYMERGFFQLKLTQDGHRDPLFDGLPAPVVYESHYCEVKQLPPRLEALASTDECRVQAMRHTSRRLYGVQFHPEDASSRFPDGHRILENFFRPTRLS